MKKSSLSARLINATQLLTKTIVIACATLAFFLAHDFALPQTANAYPFWAQQTAPETPREATGKIVCANCHLGAKRTEVEIPQSVKPDTVFEAVVKIPYDQSIQQVVGDGSKGSLQVGAVMMLPPGFKIAPEDRIPEEMKEKTEGLYFQPYKEGEDNVVIIGPLPGDQYQEIVFPVLSPNPKTEKGIYFGKYPVHVGGNRGRGQIYPTGGKTNNAIHNASVAGQITKIDNLGEDGYEVTIQPANGNAVVDTIPAGPELVVSQGQEVKAGEALTNNPNVGGFGQVDGEIVLQNPDRIKGLLAFLAITMLSQTMLVLKKKQVEKVQAAEMNF
ncbi:MAG: apocytochrome f [Crinalium sp.]